MLYSASGMDKEDFSAWLGLGIGNGGGGAPRRSHGERRPSSVQFDVLFPQSGVKEVGRNDREGSKKAEKGGRKRLKVTDGGRSSHGPSPSDDGDVNGGDAGARKKLQLTKEQSMLLEDAFRAHNIVAHVQKHELARQVNLSPRQVEVWFQNRRARTKLKQTEVDCELLKRWCESLTDENKRLKHELMGLQRSAAAAAAAGLYVQYFPQGAAMVRVCPSCDKVTVTSGGGETSKSSSYSY